MAGLHTFYRLRFHFLISTFTPTDAIAANTMVFASLCPSNLSTSLTSADARHGLSYLQPHSQLTQGGDLYFSSSSSELKLVTTALLGGLNGHGIFTSSELNRGAARCLVRAQRCPGTVKNGVKRRPGNLKLLQSVLQVRRPLQRSGNTPKAMHV